MPRMAKRRKLLNLPCDSIQPYARHHAKRPLEMKSNRIPTIIFWLIFLPVLGAIIWFVWTVFASWPPGRDRLRTVDPSTGSHQGYDPFSATANQQAAGRDQTQVKIKTKFVAFGSGTEELSFDWIVSPVQTTTEQAAPSDSGKPSD